MSERVGHRVGPPAPLGILGGTFDPVHIAHLRLAIEAREALGLSAVRLIPAGAPPLRPAPHATARQRLAMVECAIAAQPGFSIDSGELMADSPSYTVATLERLRAELGPDQSLVLLVGADAFARLEAWHRWRELFALTHIAVATRPGHVIKVGAGETALDQEMRARQGEPADLTNAPAGRIVPFTITPLEISATAIRERLGRGADVRHLVPDRVLDYIDLTQLYRNSYGH